MTESWSISEGARKSWDRKVPYYLRVRDHFASLIETGTLAPQSKLPPERVVGHAFGITRMTIRQALFQLEAEGLIYRLNRRGWFVSPPRLRYDPTANSSFVDMVVAVGQQPFDYLAVVPVVEGAGGCITDWDGKPLGLDSDGRILVTATAELHREALNVIQAA